MPATTPGRLRSEQVAAFDRNAWSRSIGIPGRNRRNPQIFDCGTGAYRLAAELMAQGKAINANILLGHTHWDHIQGFPFFSPAFVKGNSVAIYGPEGSRGSLHDVLAGQMEFT